MSKIKGKVIPYLDWLQMESFIPPTHQLLLSFVNKGKFHDRVPFVEDSREMEILEEIIIGMPKFDRDTFFSDN